MTENKTLGMTGRMLCHVEPVETSRGSEQKTGTNLFKGEKNERQYRKRERRAKRRKRKKSKNKKDFINSFKRFNVDIFRFCRVHNDTRHCFNRGR